ncbi:hypothetical protein HPC37_06145 [Pasteurellaceae bacterium 20609_3]|uniref:hypothetical protein n=1 Tax=Spirabiliibacterium mucosae TaxID=28156 RepID=UPI001AACEFFE|nr:hypothetical protein [Spirabiliibacterium mucosae]MBE2898396.1 hypothetical protein [Spirabiliibacterium mucosae]
MKKFDLDKALAGEPIKLRDGSKAYILRELKGTRNAHVDCFVGFYIYKGVEYSIAWTKAGISTMGYREHSIAGMWKEQIRYINGVKVPHCVTIDEWDETRPYYFVYYSSSHMVTSRILSKNDPADVNLVERGLVFTTEEGALAMAKALLNYTVEDI